jgi:hypothetical protein
MNEICILDAPRTKLLECDPCTRIFFERVSRVELALERGKVVIIVVRRYELRTCYLGLALGPLAYSLTLLPREELEIEVVRRTKFSRSLHEQRSVESEFRFEFQNTTRDEWRREHESNFRIHADEGFSVFGLGVSASQDYSTREAAAEQHLSEVVTKAANRVSERYDIAVDVKSEVENLYRSVRRVSNPNPCHPVIYLYYRLAKKYRSELFLTDIRFDVRRQVPPFLAGQLATTTFSATPPYRQNLDLQVVPPPPPWTITAAAPAAEAARAFATTQAVAFARPAATIAQLPPVHVPEEDVDVMRLTREEAIERIRVAQDVDPKHFESALTKFLALPVNKRERRAAYEYCIATDGLYVEGNVSKCAVCDDHGHDGHGAEVE